MDLVRFYACAGDTVPVAAKLVAKALERGDEVCVCGDADTLKRLSDRLWLAPGFLAHAGPAASIAVLRHSRVRLSEEPAEKSAPPLILNLGADLDLSRLRARRLFEVFGPTPPERQAARARYRRCQAIGWPTETVQVGAA